MTETKSVLREYINELIPVLKSDDSIQRAIDLLEEYKLNSLPVVSSDDDFLGNVQEDFLMSLPDWSIDLGEIEVLDSAVCLDTNNHLFDAFKFLKNKNIDAAPIVDEGKYVGVITLHDLMKLLGNLLAVDVPGGVIVLHMQYIDYSLAEIARLAELNDTKLLSTSVLYTDDPVWIDVVLKFNTSELNAVIASYERHDYKVVEKYSISRIVDQSEENLQNFLKFIDI